MKKSLFPLIILFVAMGDLRGSTILFEKHEEIAGGPRSWAYEFGIAMITSNTIENFVGVGGFVDRANGPAGGEIYTFTASRRLGQLVWNLDDNTFTPQIELPFTMEVVNENAGSTFLAFAGSFKVRWIDFPWNDYVKTSFAMGLGLNYSGQIYQIDEERHPGDGRSHLKFN